MAVPMILLNFSCASSELKACDNTYLPKSRLRNEDTSSEHKHYYKKT